MKALWGLANIPYLISLLPFHLVLILSHVIDTLGHPIRHKTLIIHHLFSDLHGLAKRLPANHAVVPSLDIGELLSGFESWTPSTMSIRSFHVTKARSA